MLDKEMTNIERVVKSMRLDNLERFYINIVLIRTNAMDANITEMILWASPML